MFDRAASGIFKRALTFLRLRLAGDPPPGSPHDPYAWTPAPLKPRPNIRSGAVALTEPDPDERDWHPRADAGKNHRRGHRARQAQP
jgi:hypothetical protein